MDKPLVSVITPAYNAEKYLGEAIKSVLAQTYSNWELIIVDDGSTDGTARLVKEYADKDRRIFYYHQENKRMASARNAGIARAKGKYVAFLDADNIFLPDKLSRQIEYLELHPECGICYGGIFHFYNDRPEMLYQNVSELEAPSGDFFKALLHKNFINVLAVLARRELITKFGAFPEGWTHCEDHYFWVNFAHHKVRFCRIDDRVGLLRLHQTNDSSSQSHLFNTAKTLLKFLDVMESRFTAEKKILYENDILILRKKYKRLLFIGKLLLNPLCSWILVPLYRMRRRGLYAFAGARGDILRD